jgi:hypothetical protein
MKWRKLNRIIHRDLGYFFFGMTVIYALSGIALNHIDDWDPSYIIRNEQIEVNDLPGEQSKINKKKAKEIASRFVGEDDFKNYYFPQPGQLKIFVEDGSIVLNMKTGKGTLETSKKRPVFFEVNYLHYNPRTLWTWFSDIYAISLILIAVSGLFILRGRQGITGRGAWLTAAGVIIPLLFLLFYL